MWRTNKIINNTGSDEPQVIMQTVSRLHFQTKANAVWRQKVYEMPFGFSFSISWYQELFPDIEKFNSPCQEIISSSDTRKSAFISDTRIRKLILNIEIWLYMISWYSIGATSNAHYLWWSTLEPLIWPQVWVQMGLWNNPVNIRKQGLYRTCIQARPYRLYRICMDKSFNTTGPVQDL